MTRMKWLRRMRRVPSRNVWRVAAFDVAPPVAAIGGLLLIGAAVDWPWWWVSATSVLTVLIIEAVAVNMVLWRRDAVTFGTDDDRPGLRLGVVALCALTLVAAVSVGYLRWTVPDRGFAADSAQVVRIATEVAEATATFSPRDPSGALERVAELMVPERADTLGQDLAAITAEMVRDNIDTRAAVISAGLEALGPTAASVVVLLRGTRTEPGKQTERRVLALRVALTNQHERWLVLDVVPIQAR